MRRIVSFAFCCAVAALGLGLAACGNGIGETEAPELQVDNTEILIDDMSPADDTDSGAIPDDISVTNIGPGDLEITSIEWVEKPERVVPYYAGPVTEDDPDCDDAADCSGDGICLGVASQCRDRGFRDLSDTYGQDVSFTQALAVLASDDTIVCPEADGEDLPDNYCGALEIETNAQNDDEANNIDTGNVTIYLVSDGSSGLFSLPSTFMEYTFATPGVTDTKTLQIENSAGSPLTIDEVFMNASGGQDAWFEANPQLEGLEIPGNTTESIELSMTPPEDADDEDLEASISVTFETSSVSSEQGMTIDITAGPGTVPIIGVEPLQMSFEDGEPQTLTVSNYGGATLSLRGMEIRPNDVEEHYRVTNDDDDVDNWLDEDSLPVVTAGSEEEPTSEQFEVHLDNPGAETTVGELRINHGDSLADNLSVVSLLGASAEVAVGIVEPSRVDFRSDGGDETIQTRHMALTNTGNAPLEVTDVDMEVVAGTAGEAEWFDVETVDGDSLAGTTVPAGGIQEIVASYEQTGSSDQFEPSIAVELTSNHAGQSETMEFTMATTQLNQPSFAIELMPGFSDSAEVGAQTSFTVTADSDDARIDSASWYLLKRPQGSESVIDGAGEQVTMLPDVAGTYRVAVIVDDENNNRRELQEILEFEAVDS